MAAREVRRVREWSCTGATGALPHKIYVGASCLPLAFACWRAASSWTKPRTAGRLAIFSLPITGSAPLARSPLTNREASNFTHLSFRMEPSLGQVLLHQTSIAKVISQLSVAPGATTEPEALMSHDRATKIWAVTAPQRS